MLESRESTPEEERLAGLRFRVHLPAEEGVSPKDRPLVVMVHGRAGDFNVMWIFSKVIQGVRPVIVAPQATVPDDGGTPGKVGYSWWRVDDKPPEDEAARRIEVRKEMLAAIERLVFFVDRVEQLFGTDRSQRIGFGFSQGAALIGSASIIHPELFSGVAMLAGMLPKSLADEPGVFPVDFRARAKYFIAHGTEDKIVPFYRAEQSRNLLQLHGAEVDFVSEPVGHKTGSVAMRRLGEWYHRLQKKSDR